MDLLGGGKRTARPTPAQILPGMNSRPPYRAALEIFGFLPIPGFELKLIDMSSVDYGFDDGVRKNLAKSGRGSLG